jgi:branched-chain amino acid transport system permease protein
MTTITSVLPEGNAIREHLVDAAPHMRLFLMGLILLVVMRYAPRGLLPERQ